MINNIKITQKDNHFIANVEGLQFVVKVTPEGLETIVFRNSLPIQKKQVTTDEEQILEQVHEGIVEIIINEVHDVFGNELDELLSKLDNQLNDSGLDQVVDELVSSK